MKNIPLGAKVECSDGSCGQATHVIINPVNQEITHFVLVDEKGAIILITSKASIVADGLEEHYWEEI